MEDMEDINKAEVYGSTRLEASPDGVAAVDGVAPGVLAAVIIGVLCCIALLFSVAVLMDRWNKRFYISRSKLGPMISSTKIAILDDTCPTSNTEPPAAVPSTSRPS